MYKHSTLHVIVRNYVNRLITLNKCQERTGGAICKALHVGCLHRSHTYWNKRELTFICTILSHNEMVGLRGQSEASATTHHHTNKSSNSTRDARGDDTHDFYSMHGCNLGECDAFNLVKLHKIIIDAYPNSFTYGKHRCSRGNTNTVLVRCAFNRCQCNDRGMLVRGDECNIITREQQRMNATLH